MTPVSAVRLRELREAVANYPNSSDVHLKLGSALVKLGLYHEAKTEIQRAIELDPSNVKAWVNLGGGYSTSITSGRMAASMYLEEKEKGGI